MRAGERLSVLKLGLLELLHGGCSEVRSLGGFRNFKRPFRGLKIQLPAWLPDHIPPDPSHVALAQKCPVKNKAEGPVPGEGSFLKCAPDASPGQLHPSSIDLSQRGFHSCALHDVEHPRRHRIPGSCRGRDLSSHSPQQP